ncbi:hypothetical protein AVEN_142954-1 [Araneus ventricosus]|uniref:Uncharacterized protein n=1 Tax=Araneus ventricosus TaxID=182803 RepID=A0A4Y2M5M1_ARAVE|nr:hypothetical protein AVEN_142954-1 [Araneus ventricosus]
MMHSIGARTDALGPIGNGDPKLAPISTENRAKCMGARNTSGACDYKLSNGAFAEWLPRWNVVSSRARITELDTSESARNRANDLKTTP